MMQFRSGPRNRMARDPKTNEIGPNGTTSPITPCYCPFLIRS